MADFGVSLVHPYGLFLERKPHEQQVFRQTGSCESDSGLSIGGIRATQGGTDRSLSQRSEE